MRHTEQSGLLLLTITLLFSGCATNRGSRSPQYRPAAESAPDREYDPKPEKSSPGSPIPPPPAPAAYGVSHVKSVGFLRVLGNRSAADRSCGTAACAEGCSPAPMRKRCLFDCLCGKNNFRWFGCRSADTRCSDSEECCTDDVCVDEACGETAPCQQECANDWADFGLESGEGCTTDRHPCLADRFEDPFLDEFQEAESVHEQPEAPATPEVIPAAPTPQALFPSPYTGVSSRKTTDRYFPTESGRQRSIIEPPHWQDRHNARSTAKYHAVTVETSASSEWTPAPLQIKIQPRQRFGR